MGLTFLIFIILFILLYCYIKKCRAAEPARNDYINVKKDVELIIKNPYVTHSEITDKSNQKEEKQEEEKCQKKPTVFGEPTLRCLKPSKGYENWKIKSGSSKKKNSRSRTPSPNCEIFQVQPDQLEGIYANVSTGPNDNLPICQTSETPLHINIENNN